MQARHQKLVEIAPAPNLDPRVAAAMHADALRLVEAAGYVNAGTVEFLLEPSSGRFFFIECNPRIQVCLGRTTLAKLLARCPLRPLPHSSFRP